MRISPYSTIPLASHLTLLYRWQCPHYVVWSDDPYNAPFLFYEYDWKLSCSINVCVLLTHARSYKYAAPLPLNFSMRWHMPGVYVCHFVLSIVNLPLRVRNVLKTVSQLLSASPQETASAQLLFYRQKSWLVKDEQAICRSHSTWCSLALFCKK